MTSLKLGAPHSIATRRSKPKAMPPCGGAPSSNAPSKCEKLSTCAVRQHFPTQVNTRGGEVNSVHAQHPQLPSRSAHIPLTG